MNGHRVSYAAVIVAAVAHFVLGAVWFTILSAPWLAGIGKTREELMRTGSPTLAYVIAFVSNLVMASILAWLISATGRPTVARGALWGALVWLGFVATTMGTAFVFEARSLESFAITAGYPLAGLLIMGAIVGGWTKKPLTT
jgi:hypothetical protein